MQKRPLSTFTLLSTTALLSLAPACDEDTADLDTDIELDEGVLESLPEDLPPPVAARLRAGGPDATEADEELDVRRVGSRLVTEFGGSGTFTVPPTEGEAVHDEDTEFADASFVANEVVLTWAELDSGNAAPDEAHLDSETLTLRLHNPGDAPRDVEVRLVGDRGTTQDYDLGSILVTVAPGQTTEHPVSVTKLRPTQVGLAGQLRASARVYDPESGDVAERVSVPPVFFRAEGHEGKGLAVFDAERLALERFRGLDDAAARDLATTDLDDFGSRAAEPTVTLRAVQWESPAGYTRFADPDTDPEIDAEVDLNPEHAHVLETDRQDQTEATYNLCVRWEIQTEDSGNYNNRGYTEDYWNDADDGIQVPAYGVRVRVGNTTYDTDPDTGCVSFTGSSSVQNVRVYAYATNTYDTFARMHDGGKTQLERYPGNTYSWYVSGVRLSSGRTSIVSVGDYTKRATGMATLAYALKRYAHGVYNSEYHVAGDVPQSVGCGTTQHYYTDQHAAYLAFADPYECSNSNLAKKFVVAHEYGHGFGSLRGNNWVGSNYGFDAEWSGNCPDQSSSNGHKHNSIEHNFTGMMEGWANFVAAVVFNNKTQIAHMSMHGNDDDMETWNASQFSLAGGYIKWNCVPQVGQEDELVGASVPSDWSRQFWDMWTDPAVCSPAPSATDMLRIYSATTLQPNVHNEQDLGWFHSKNAVDEVIDSGQLGGCYDSYWNSIGIYNGVNH